MRNARTKKDLEHDWVFAGSHFIEDPDDKKRPPLYAANAGAELESFIRHGGFQCGICTPGQIVSATALLRERPHTSDADVREWMKGSLCRCTGYEGIRTAIRVAAEAGGA